MSKTKDELSENAAMLDKYYEAFLKINKKNQIESLKQALIVYVEWRIKQIGDKNHATRNTGKRKKGLGGKA